MYCKELNEFQKRNTLWRHYNLLASFYHDHTEIKCIIRVIDICIINYLNPITMLYYVYNIITWRVDTCSCVWCVQSLILSLSDQNCKCGENKTQTPKLVKLNLL